MMLLVWLEMRRLGIRIWQSKRDLVYVINQIQSLVVGLNGRESIGGSLNIHFRLGTCFSTFLASSGTSSHLLLQRAVSRRSR